MQRTLRPSAVRAALTRRRQSIARAAVEACEPRRLLADATVTGTVFNDANKDGVRQNGEAGLSGYTVYADRNYNGVKESTEPSAVTNASGFYSLGVPTGPNSVAIRLLNVPSSQVTAPAGGAHSAKFTTAYTASNRNFGVSGNAPTPNTRLTLEAWIDSDGDGYFDSSSEADTPEAYALNVWLDLNKNGLRDAGEAALPIDPDPEAPRARYHADVAPGSYTIAVRLEGDADAYADYTVPATVPSGQSQYTVSLPIPVTSTVSGRVTLDANRNGVADPGEAGTSQATVWADYDEDAHVDAGEPVAKINADGSYSIEAERRSLVVVRLGPNAGYEVTGPDGRGITTWDPVANVNFSIAPKATTGPAATVTGTVYRDGDKDGVRDSGEAGLADYTVYGDLNYNGARDANEPTAVTNASGFYSLSVPVSSNSVAIRLLNVAPSAITAPAGGAHSGKFTTAYTAANRNFGVAPTTPTPATGSVSFGAYYDANDDGYVSSTDTPVSDATVWLDLNNNGLRESAEPLLTFTSGRYTLSNVAPGGYTVALRRAGDPDAYSDYNTAIGVSAGSTTYNNLAVPTTSTVRGVVFTDADGDGVRDAGEAGQGGLTVFADYDYDGIRDAGFEPFAMTAADGTYALRGVRSDNVQFWITLTKPAGTVVTKPSGTDGNVYKGRFDRAYDVSGRDFGLRNAGPDGSTATVSGVVYNDANQNGQRDAGEVGAAGQIVWVESDGNYDLNSTVEPYAIVGADGSYTITGVPNTSGQSLRLLQQSGGIGVSAPAGGSYDNLPVAAGASLTGRDFGVYRRDSSSDGAHVFGYVFADDDRNGRPDARAYPISSTFYGVPAYADYNNNGRYDAGEPASDGRGGNFGLTTIRGRFTVRLLALDAKGLVQTGPANGGGIVVDTTVSDYFFFLPFTAASVQPGVVHRTFLTARDDLNRNGSVDENERFTSYDVSNGRIFADLNKNGLYDANEPVATPTRIAEGNVPGVDESKGDWYIDLAPGTYDLSFTRGTAIGSAAVVTRTVTLAGSSSTERFVPLPVAPITAGVTGFVYLDNNGDAVRQPDEPADYSNIFVDLDDDGVLDPNEPWTAPNTSDGIPGHEGQLPGEYYLSGLAPGTYSIRALDFDPIKRVSKPSANRYTVTLAAGETKFNIDFAQTPTPPGAFVAGTVFNDLNRNGIQDSGEAGIAGKTVFGDYDYDGVLDANESSYVTDANGRYYLSRITAGRSVGVRILNQPASSVTNPSGGVASARYYEGEYRYTNFGLII